MIKIAIICNLDEFSGGSNQYQYRLLNLFYESKIKNPYFEFIIVNPPKEFNQKKETELIIKQFKSSFIDRVHQTLLRSVAITKLLKIINLGDLRLEKLLLRLNVSYAYFLTPDIRSISFHTIPVISTVWDVGHRKLQDLNEFKLNNNFEYLESFYMKLLRKSCLIFVDSDRTSIEIQKLYSLLPDKIVNLGMQWAISKSYEKSNETIAVSSNSIYIYYPSNYWSHKNHFFILKVLKEILNSRSDVKLILTGKDQLGHKLKVEKYIEKLNLEAYVLDLGYLGEYEQIQLYKQIKCLVYPTLLGPTNIPPYEAAFLGVPSVLSPAHEKKSYQIEGIFIMDDYNVQAWKERILSIIDSGTQADQNFLDRIPDPIEIIMRALEKKLNILTYADLDN